MSNIQQHFTQRLELDEKAACQLPGLCEIKHPPTWGEEAGTPKRASTRGGERKLEMDTQIGRHITDCAAGALERGH